MTVHYHQILPEGLMQESVQEEPAFTAATVVAVVTAIIGLAVAFGVPVTSQQQAAILTLVGIIGPFLVARYVRKRTVTTATNAEQVAAALAKTPPGRGH